MIDQFSVQVLSLGTHVFMKYSEKYQYCFLKTVFYHIGTLNTCKKQSKSGKSNHPLNLITACVTLCSIKYHQVFHITGIESFTTLSTNFDPLIFEEMFKFNNVGLFLFFFFGHIGDF